MGISLGGTHSFALAVTRKPLARRRELKASVTRNGVRERSRNWTAPGPKAILGQATCVRTFIVDGRFLLQCSSSSSSFPIRRQKSQAGK
ncbi:ADP-L-glycero-D-manno-heptose-6-epimerase [Anopheles sinensis]|uniref:ADP-L-glycero-D-manno-heptose-6-epimerase n=1 Tax=Anopheles sinensis TaxID=74873 RepID=A0A084VLV1_ANOSI|nr:ADP-L-glycero-D-manno-heptose-6-epimerase [Anopheles sinensis]